MKRFLLTAIVLAATAISVFAQGTKVAMLVCNKSGLTGSESTASSWLTEVYGSDSEVIQPSDLLSSGSPKDLKETYRTIWVMNDGGSTIEMSTEQKTALDNFVKYGGNLVLTNMATPLVAQIGRIHSKFASMNSENKGDSPIHNDIYGVNPNIGGSGTTVSADDHRNDRIYLGMYRFYDDDGRFIYPLSNSNATVPLANACFWDMNETSYGLSDNKMHDFEQSTNSTVLGTWQHVTDYCCACLVVFHPTTTYQGTVIACGLSSYNWSSENDMLNKKILTKNMLDYQDTNPRAYGYTEEAVPTVKKGAAADIDNTVYRFNPTIHTAYLYDAHHEKMFIRRIPAVVRFDGYDFDFSVVGIDPRMAEIPLKYVDIDQGGEENRSDVRFDIDVALNPHKYFNPYVIVYVLNRDLTGMTGESTGDNSVNVCIEDHVNILRMEDKHPVMFPGKGPGYIGDYPIGHAFDVRKQIIFERQFTAGRTSTLILPFDLTADEAESYGTFYDFSGFVPKEAGSQEASQLKFTKHTGGTTARVPYIFVPKTATMPDLYYGEGHSEGYKRVWRTIDEGGEYDHSIDHGNYQFHGSFEFLKVYGHHWDDPDYPYWDYATRIGSEHSAKAEGIYSYYNDPASDDNRFVTSTEWIGMGTFRCYIRLTNPEPDDNISSNTSKTMSIMAKFFDDEVSGISLLEADNISIADGTAFNIMGQRIDASQPGLQIINGKKYFNRK